MIFSKAKIFLSIIVLVASFNTMAAGWVTDVEKYCVYSHNSGVLSLEVKNALRYSGNKKCTRGKCNNSKKNYLKRCKNFVHADCFRAYRKQGNKFVVAGTSKTGFHKGKGEGGKSNNHYWDSMIKNITIKGAKKGRWIRAYNEPSCKGKYVSFRWK